MATSCASRRTWAFAKQGRQAGHLEHQHGRGKQSSLALARPNAVTAFGGRKSVIVIRRARITPAAPPPPGQSWRDTIAGGDGRRS